MKNSNYIWKAINSHLYEHIFDFQLPVQDGLCIGFRICFSVFSSDPEPWMSATTIHAAVDQLYSHIPHDYYAPCAGGFAFYGRNFSTSDTYFLDRNSPACCIWWDNSLQRLRISYLYPPNNNTNWVATHHLKECTDGGRGGGREWGERIRKIF